MTVYSQAARMATALAQRLNGRAVRLKAKQRTELSR